MTGRPSVAAAYVVRDGHLLMVRHRLRQPEWGTPAGNVEPGETPEQAGVRETVEEVGVAIEPISILGDRVHPASERHLIYVACRYVSGEPRIVDHEEVADGEWVPIPEALERWSGLIGGVFPPVREYLGAEWAAYVARVAAEKGEGASDVERLREITEDTQDLLDAIEAMADPENKGAGVTLEEMKVELHGRAFREAWIAGVRRHYPGDPKPSYVAPWEEMPEWERASAAAVHDQVAAFVRATEGASGKLSREQKGCWIGQIYRHFPDPKPAYVADWDAMPEWQRETDADIFERIEAAAAR